MRTATVTWTSYNGYGTLLQAYALQRVIENLGVSNIIISDEMILMENLQVLRDNRRIIEEYEKSLQIDNEQVNELKEENKASKLSRFFSHPIISSKKIIYYIIEKYFPNLGQKISKCFENAILMNQEKCEVFKKQNMKILYGKARQDLKDLNNKFDVFICGSDQIWNPSPRCYFDGFFYLDFVTKKKIAYAPSVGVNRIPNQYVTKIKDYLDSFTSISTREYLTSKQLSELLGKKVEWVLDPTLLLTKDEWKDFSLDSTVPQINSNYLLCYFLNNEKWYFDYAEKLAKKLKLKVVLIPNKKEFCVSNHLKKYGVGPKEFLSLLKNAKFVLTDSYHGILFSILFEKQFIPLQRFDDCDETNENIRIDSLLDLFNLKRILVSKENSHLINIVNISYPEVNKILITNREYSLNYLRKAILCH